MANLSSVSDKQSLKQLYMKIHPNTRKMAIANMAGSIWRFVKEIKEGDLVFLPLLSQDSKTIAICKVEGDFTYKELTPEIKHIRPVKWPIF